MCDRKKQKNEKRKNEKLFEIKFSKCERQRGKQNAKQTKKKVRRALCSYYIVSAKGRDRRGMCTNSGKRKFISAFLCFAQMKKKKKLPKTEKLRKNCALNK